MSVLAGILSAGGSLLGSALGYHSQQQTNALNKKMLEDTNRSNEEIAYRTNYFNREIARDTNETNRQIAEQNLGFQRSMQEYNRALQNKIFEREDTSYQRTAQDMLAAGLNPLDMQGTNGAGEVISQAPLENTYQAQIGAPMQAHSNEAFRQENAFNSAMSASSALASVAQAIDSVETGQIQRDSIQLDNDRKALENYLLAETHGIKNYGHSDYDRISAQDISVSKNFDIASQKSYIENLKNWNEYQRSSRELSHMISAGKYDTDTEFERILTSISDWINNGRGADEWNKLEKTFPILRAFKNSY